jgi:RNA polymerase sigma-70 factor (ECF subfamily)
MQRRPDIKALEQASERTLVLLTIAGDAPAFRELVLRHQGSLRTLLRRIADTPAHADDLAQAAFLKAWENLHKLRNTDAFAGWLRRIALNLAFDDLRRKDRNFASLDIDTKAAPESVEERLDLDAALRRLSVPARTCVLLFHGENLSHAEIAAETGMPLGTVKSHITRATPLLREWLRDWRNADG